MSALKKRRKENHASSGKTGSIARRIAWDFQRKRLWRILWTTVLIAVAAVVLWCAAVELYTLGDLMAEDRSIYFNNPYKMLTVVGVDDYGEEYVIYSNVDEVETNYIPFGERVARQLAGENMFSSFFIYSFEGPDGESYYWEIGNFIFWLCFVLLGQMVIRLLFWLLSAPGATGRIRRYMRPIDDIAQVTESISASAFDVSKFQSLEEAIDHLNGVSPDEKLQIGDSDLSGLETAVNNLLARMRSGYRQQVRFVDDASHELRTPIAVVLGYVDMLDRWGKTDPQVLDEGIAAIKAEAEHMKALVEQLLFLARGDAGRQELHIKAMDASALVGEVWKESQMIDPAHEYVLDVKDTVPMMGDEAMLKQAVRILTDNAAKYSPEGSRVTLRAFPEADHVCVQVQDNGMGMKAEDMPRIFDRFYRADAARNSQTGGSGLGLSIAKWIVGKHGGRFQVTSYEGVGTRITIILPGKREQKTA